MKAHDKCLIMILIFVISSIFLKEMSESGNYSYTITLLHYFSVFCLFISFCIFLSTENYEEKEDEFIFKPSIF